MQYKERMAADELTFEWTPATEATPFDADLDFVWHAELLDDDEDEDDEELFF